MARQSSSKRSPVAAAADEALMWCALALVALILLGSLGRENELVEAAETRIVRGAALHGRWRRPCDEIYVVEEGETLHSISDKCGDPFIVEENPHIHDPDDVFPGLVIKITPSNMPRKL
ncbi:hypothetical protein QJS10_CPB15g00646 [Acorus calamus]|uniref:LysM domain-containing protein n=1 Tax=Acorus calamus TaxID=4465 RepID=A0AAV9D9R5_ACOCL|nr:hypothetical protein QJS10_CPB15g00646 [Acorus calamus]